jgi:hypothetical protein
VYVTAAYLRLVVRFCGESDAVGAKQTQALLNRILAAAEALPSAPLRRRVAWLLVHNLTLQVPTHPHAYVLLTLTLTLTLPRAGGVRFRFPVESVATPQAVRGMARPTLQPHQDPVLLLPWACFRGGGFPRLGSGSDLFRIWRCPNPNWCHLVIWCHLASSVP